MHKLHNLSKCAKWIKRVFTICLIFAFMGLTTINALADGQPQPVSSLNGASQAVIIAIVALVWIAVLVIDRYIRKKKTSGRGTPGNDQRGEAPAAAPSDVLSAARPTSRLEFISWLRGVACISVVAVHYFGVYFSGLQASFSQILPGSHTMPKVVGTLLTFIEASHISLGATGVGIFFLITGFVTTMSLQRDNRVSFLLKRLIRIWPVYIAGTAVLYIVSRLYTAWAGTAMPAGVKGFLIQASLIRDFLWVPSVDGIGWTLEVQVKIYVVLFLLSKLRLLDKWKVMAGLSLLGALFVAAVQPYLGTWLQTNMRLYVTAYVLSTSAVYVIFSFIGAAFCNLFTGKWDLRESAAAVAVCAYAFYLSSVSTNSPLTSYYFAAAAIFAIAYVIRDQIRTGRVMAFISKISFSLYIVHALNGFYLLSVLDHMGVGFYPAVMVTITAAVGLAYVLYIAVERPCAKLSKKITKRPNPGN